MMSKNRVKNFGHRRSLNKKIVLITIMVFLSMLLIRITTALMSTVPAQKSK